MKLMYIVYVCIKMFSIMYNINTTSILNTGSHKSFPILCGNSLKCILLYLYCINYNEINIFHLGIQKHVSHEKWLKSYKYLLYSLAQKFGAIWRKIRNYIVIQEFVTSLKNRTNMRVFLCTLQIF